MKWLALIVLLSLPACACTMGALGPLVVLGMLSSLAQSLAFLAGLIIPTGWGIWVLRRQRRLGEVAHLVAWFFGCSTALLIGSLSMGILENVLTSAFVAYVSGRVCQRWVGFRRLDSL